MNTGKKTMKEDKCQSCKHWELIEHPYGYCRYSPPTPHLGSPKEETYANWPRVQKDDWCSHHEKTEAKSLGIFRCIGRNVVEPFYEWYSVNYRWKRRRWLDKGKKVPESFSEYYVLCSIAFGILSFILASILACIGIFYWWFLIPIALIILIITYKITETVIFFIHWILLARTPLYSYKRSLVSVSLNLLEIGVYFTTIFVFAGCFGPWDALYNTGINILTISITSPDCASGLCKFLMILELAIVDFLILIILASLVGQLRRREGYK